MEPLTWRRTPEYVDTVCRMCLRSSFSHVVFRLRPGEIALRIASQRTPTHAMSDMQFFGLATLGRDSTRLLRIAPTAADKPARKSPTFAKGHFLYSALNQCEPL